MLRQDPSEKIEFELVRFGPGQIIGEISHTLKHEVFSIFRDVKKFHIAESDLDVELRNQATTLGEISSKVGPIKIKCSSVEG